MWDSEFDKELVCMCTKQPALRSICKRKKWNIAVLASQSNPTAFLCVPWGQSSSVCPHECPHYCLSASEMLGGVRIYIYISTFFSIHLTIGIWRCQHFRWIFRGPEQGNVNTYEGTRAWIHKKRLGKLYSTSIDAWSTISKHLNIVD